MSLLDEIRNAQVRAGEDVVVAHLERSGLRIPKPEVHPNDLTDNERRLIGEAKVLRELLAEAAAVIATLEGQCSTEQAMLDELRFTIDKALKPTPDGGLL